jgi:hypothetical protein
MSTKVEEIVTTNYNKMTSSIWIDPRAITEITKLTLWKPEKLVSTISFFPYRFIDSNDLKGADH